MAWAQIFVLTSLLWFVESIPVDTADKDVSRSLPEQLPRPMARRSASNWQDWQDYWVAQRQNSEHDLQERYDYAPKTNDNPTYIPSNGVYETQPMQDVHQPHQPMYIWRFTPVRKHSKISSRYEPLNTWISEKITASKESHHPPGNSIANVGPYASQYELRSSWEQPQDTDVVVGAYEDPRLYFEIYGDGSAHRREESPVNTKSNEYDYVAASNGNHAEKVSQVHIYTESSTKKLQDKEKHVTVDKGNEFMEVTKPAMAYDTEYNFNREERNYKNEVKTAAQEKPVSKNYYTEVPVSSTVKSTSQKSKEKDEVYQSSKSTESAKDQCEDGDCQTKYKTEIPEHVSKSVSRPLNATDSSQIESLDHKLEDYENWEDCDGCWDDCVDCESVDENQRDMDKELLENNFMNSIDSKFRSLIFNPMAESHEKFQSCVAPNNETGNCRYIQHCLLSNIIGGVQQFMNYVCLINDRFLGVCCPEFPVSQVDVKWDQVVSEGNETFGETFVPEECGVSSKTRVVGGSKADPAEYPWMAALLTMDKGQFFCGGSVINEQYILTAAHCTFSVPRNQILVRLGEYDFGNEDQEFPGEDYPVVEIKRHGLYSRRTLQHDIALLKLGRKINFHKRVGTICFPEKNETFVGETATLAGWGNTKGGGPSSEVLLEAALTVVPNDVCSENHGLPVPSTFICTQSEDKEKGACNGDSGGPLMLMDEDTKIWKIIGLVSWGRRGCEPKFPTVYTRITDYLDWIENHSN